MPEAIDESLGCAPFGCALGSGEAFRRWPIGYEDSTLNNLAHIDIVIVVHARTQAELAKLHRTQLSIEAQRLDEGFRVSHFVLDNASPLELPSRSGWSVKRLEQNNMGAARDLALRLSPSAYLAFVDADVELDPDWLRTLYDQLRDHDELWGVASANRPPANESGFHASLGLFLETWLGHLGSPQAWRPRVAVKVRHLSTSAVLFRRSRLIEVGGFSAKFSRVAEDLELGVRASRAGAQFLLLPSPSVVHRQTPSWANWWARMFRYGWGQIEVWRVHPREICTRKVLPLIAAWLGVALILVSLRQASPWPLCWVMLIHATLLAASLPRVWTLSGLRALLLGLITHYAYATGMWLGQWGLWRNPTHPKPSTSSPKHFKQNDGHRS